MTERERVSNRKRYAARLARIDREIEAFKKAAKVVPTRRLYGDKGCDVTEYADTVTKGLVLRFETAKPEHRPTDLWGREIP